MSTTPPLLQISNVHLSFGGDPLLEGADLSVGAGARKDNGELITPAVNAGDKVLFGKWSGTEVTVDGQELLMMKESDIMGILSTFFT